MASHELHFTVSQNGVEDPSALHDPATMPATPAPQSGTNFLGETLSQSAHPIVCIFHLLFKSLALFFYIFGGWFSGDGKGGNSGANFITVTVVCILLLAADFWVVKNITGRLLVGLRWWNRVDGDKTTWIFESAKDRHVNKFDSSVFWTVLYGTPFVWGGLMIIGILKFNLGWLITVLTAVALSSANVYGYYKCSSDQKAKFQQMVSEGATRGAMTVMRGNMMGWLTGTSQAPATAPAQPQANSFA